MSESKFPRDFAVMSRYYDAIRARIPARYPIPAPVPLEKVDEFVKENAEKYKVQWLEGAAESTPAGGMAVGQHR